MFGGIRIGAAGHQAKSICFLRVFPGKRQGHVTAQGMSHQDGLADAQEIHQPGDILRHLVDGVRALRCLAGTVPAQVRQNKVRILVQQGDEVLPDGVVQRIAVDQDDGQPAAGSLKECQLVVVHVNHLLDLSLLQFLHRDGS